MMSLEDAFISEARRLGYQPDREVMKAVAVKLAGSTLRDGYIVLPNGNSLAVADAVKGFRSAHPDNFTALDETPKDHGFVGLTKAYLEENRRTKLSGKPESDHRYIGLTARMIEERAAARKGEVAR